MKVLLFSRTSLKILNKEPCLNFVVFGGDLTENKDKQLSDLPLFSESAEELKVPYYVIPGDRDVDVMGNLTKQDFCAEFRRNGFSDTNNSYWAQEIVPNVMVTLYDVRVV